MDELIYQRKSKFFKGIEKKTLFYIPKFDGFYKFQAYKDKNQTTYGLIDYICPECGFKKTRQKVNKWDRFRKNWSVLCNCKRCGWKIFMFSIKEDDVNQIMYQEYLPRMINERMKWFNAYETMGWNTHPEFNKEEFAKKLIELFDEETIKELLEYTVDRVSPVPNPLNNVCVDTGDLYYFIKECTKTEIKTINSFDKINIPKNKLVLILARSQDTTMPKKLLNKFQNEEKFFFGFKEDKIEKFKVIIFE